MFRLHNDAEQAAGFGGTHRPPPAGGTTVDVSHPSKPENSQQTHSMPHSDTPHQDDEGNVRNTGGTHDVLAGEHNPAGSKDAEFGK